MIPRQIQKFIEKFSRLPSLGPRVATRLAFLFLHMTPETRRGFSDALCSMEELDFCPRCFFAKERDAKLCPMCADLRRDQRTIAIVEKETDLLTLEKSREYKGVYLILGVVPLSGVLSDEQKLRIAGLKRYIEETSDTPFNEIIIATSPTSLGDILFEIVSREFAGLVPSITRLGRGIPTGGDIEFADPETLRDALRKRA